MMFEVEACQRCTIRLASWTMIPFHQAVRGCLLHVCEECLSDLVQDMSIGDKWASVTAVMLCRL